MRKIFQTLVLGVMSGFFIVVSSTAQELTSEKKMANLLTIGESAYATAALLHDFTDREMRSVSWQAGYTENTWTLTASGESPSWFFFLEIEGTLQEAQNDTWSIQFTGNGRINDEIPLVVSGRSELLLLERTDGVPDFSEMQFEQMIRIGENSLWGWIKGSELIFGAVLGGAGAVLAAPVTGGTSLLVGLAGAVAGAGGAATLSNEVRTEFFESEEAVPSPEVPKLPEEPQVNEPIEVGEDQIMIAVMLSDEIIVGSAQGGRVRITGDISRSDRSATGSVDIE